LQPLLQGLHAGRHLVEERVLFLGFHLLFNVPGTGPRIRRRPAA
jgi:hypothetical protein